MAETETERKSEAAQLDDASRSDAPQPEVDKDRLANEIIDLTDPETVLLHIGRDLNPFEKLTMNARKRLMVQVLCELVAFEDEEEGDAGTAGAAKPAAAAPAPAGIMSAGATQASPPARRKPATPPAAAPAPTGEQPGPEPDTSVVDDKVPATPDSTAKGAMGRGVPHERATGDTSAATPDTASSPSPAS